MLLSPVGWLYGKIADIRNALYDRGVLKSHSLGARTISIGNITTGGTGKTPLVAYVASILLDAGETVCIIMRGYGRENIRERVLVSNGNEILASPHIGGDEPVELAIKLRGNRASVIADADRVSAAAWAREKLRVTVFLLDDGFQHRRAKRDLDIICIDATDSRDRRVLPAGSLREPFRNVARADAIVVTRANLETSTDELVRTIRQHNLNAPVFTAELRITRAVRLEEFPTREAAAKVESSLSFAESLFAFCGLGNPDSFIGQMKVQGYSVVGSKVFRDHHRYTQGDIQEIERAAIASGASALITTVKDAVKLRGLSFSLPCFVAEAGCVINDPVGFRDLVLSA